MLGLFVAAERGDATTVKNLLAQSQAQEISKLIDYRRRTVLHLAVEHGNHEVVDVLLGHEGAIDLLARDQGGFTALHLATIRGHGKMVKQLLAKAPDLVIMENEHRKPPLHFAVEYGHAEIIAMLMESAKSRTAHIEAMFHAAIRSGHDKVVTELLDHRPQLIDAVDHMSPLHIAAACKQHTIVELLFARRHPRFAEVGGCYEMTPLHFVVQYGYEKLVAELLVDQPHLIDAVAGRYCETVLHVAAEARQVKIAQQLLAQNPSLIDAKNSQGKTPLRSAMWRGHDEIVELLLSHKPELIDAKDKNGRTPLDQACTWGPPSTVACLLAHGPAVKNVEMLRGALRFGEDDSSICEILNLMCTCKPELMTEELWDGVLLHYVFGFKQDKELFSEALMTKVWQLSPPQILYNKANLRKDTPFHVAIKHDNTFAIELVQWNLSLNAIMAAYAKCNKKFPRRLLAQINECLLMSLNKDVVGTVWQYLKFKRPGKIITKESK